MAEPSTRRDSQDAAIYTDDTDHSAREFSDLVGPPPAYGVNGTAEQHLEKAHAEDEDDDWDVAWDDQDAEADEPLVLDDDPEELATWSGHASIKGDSDLVRMVLLTFNAIGMTCVATPPGLPNTRQNEDALTRGATASRGAWR